VEQAHSWSKLEQPDYQMERVISPIENGYSGDKVLGLLGRFGARGVKTFFWSLWAAGRRPVDFSTRS
jgi:hypothetical protein